MLLLNDHARSHKFAGTIAFVVAVAPAALTHPDC